MYDTRLGGAPVWPSYVEPKECPRCSLCGRQCVLVMQAFSPTEAHPLRILVVFSCNVAQCAEKPEAWCAWRILLQDGSCNVGASPSSELRMPGLQCGSAFVNCSVPLGEDEASCSNSAYGLTTYGLTRNGCGPDKNGSDSEGTADSDSDAEGEIASMENLLNLRNLRVYDRSSAAITSRRGQPGVLKNHKEHTVDVDDDERMEMTREEGWLNLVPVEVDYDTGTDRLDDVSDDCVDRLLKRYAEEEQAERSSGFREATHWDREVDEPDSPSTVALDRFRACLARAPGHVLRYQRGGDAIWPAHPPPPPPPLCSLCGAARVFEVQLMPTALHYLDVDKTAPTGSAGMNWSTAALYTCSNDCDSKTITSKDGSMVASVSEFVIVHPDEF